LAGLLSLNMCNQGEINNCKYNANDPNTQISLDVPLTAEVNEELPLNLTAHREEGIYELRVIKNKGEESIVKNCNFQKDCSLEFTLSQEYVGKTDLGGVVYADQDRFAASLEKIISFECEDHSCDLDPSFHDFFTWMRQKGYDECIVERYLQSSLDPENVAEMKTFLRVRNIEHPRELEISLYDLIPTDAEAEYASLSPEEAGLCRANKDWPDFCKTPERADYKFLERYLGQVFGWNITINYQQVEISYAQEFGPPEKTKDNHYRFNVEKRKKFVRQFKPKLNIVNHSITSWKGLPLTNMSGPGSGVVEMNRDLGHALGASTYTHEWGHGLGLPHNFIDKYLTCGYYDFFALAGIMSNTYEEMNGNPHKPIYDVMDPLERYALEPAEGFTDAKNFVNEYESRVVGSKILPKCGTVDLALGYVEQTADQGMVNLTFSVINQGNLDTGYITVGLDLGNEPLIQQKILHIRSGEKTPFVFSVDCNKVNPGLATLTVDSDFLINEGNEGNNQVAVHLDYLCSKKDTD